MNKLYFMTFINKSSFGYFVLISVSAFIFTKKYIL